jgi:hypothetical protein
MKVVIATELRASRFLYKRLKNLLLAVARLQRPFFCFGGNVGGKRFCQNGTNTHAAI